MESLFSPTQGNIIKNIQYLEESHLPTEILHRSQEKKHLANNISPMLNPHGTMINTFIYGPPGTGKTTTVKHLMDILHKETSKIYTAYINCWKYSTSYAVLQNILSQISDKLGYVKLKRNISELYEILNRYLTLENKKLIVVLDEIDKLEDSDILYELSRDEKYGIIMISNDEYALKDLDVRIKSSLSYDILEFKPYSLDELMDIVKQRIELALYPGKFPSPFIRSVAAASKGDARVAIGILKYAALYAEQEDAEKVSREHIVKAIKSAKKIKIMQILSSLKKEHMLLYEIIEKHERISSQKLFEEYNKIAKENKSYKTLEDRTYRNYMQTLLQKGVVYAKGETRWREYSIHPFEE